MTQEFESWDKWVEITSWESQFKNSSRKKKKKVAGLEWLDYTECVDLEVYVRHSSRGCNKIMKLKRQIWSSQNTDFKGLTH